MFCPNCGKQISGEVKFCMFCGFPLAVHSAPPPETPETQNFTQTDISYATRVVEQKQDIPQPVQPIPPVPAPFPPPAPSPSYQKQPPLPTPIAPSAFAPAPVPAYPGPAALPVRRASGWLLRLPAVGAILAVLGFFLPWDTVASASGFHFALYGIGSLANLSSWDFSNPFLVEQAVIVGLMTALVIIPLAALIGLLTLIGKKVINWLAMPLALLGLAVVIAFYAYTVYAAMLLWADVFATTGAGTYICLLGLLWMVISPFLLIGRKA